VVKFVSFLLLSWCPLPGDDVQDRIFDVRRVVSDALQVPKDQGTGLRFPLAKLRYHVLVENISSSDEFVRRFVPELERRLCDPESIFRELEFQFPRKLKLEQQGQLFNQRDQNHSKREFCRLLELHRPVALSSPTRRLQYSAF